MLPAESTVIACGLLPVVTSASFGPQLTVETPSGVIFVTLFDTELAVYRFPLESIVIPRGWVPVEAVQSVAPAGDLFVTSLCQKLAV